MEIKHIKKHKLARYLENNEWNEVELQYQEKVARLQLNVFQNVAIRDINTAACSNPYS